MSDNTVKKEENEYLVKFKSPFIFEEKEYESVDLSALENLSGEDLCDAHKALISAGIQTLLAEQDPTFAAILASKATQLPVELFKALPARELNKVKTRVSMYFFGQD